ncbi:hypothetical protein QYF36_014931 [Acer negundo]|nr:hypothetical protein QYF36_014931 [Acer negundo]
MHLRDLELAKLLIRPRSLFLDDLSKSNNFTSEGNGKVNRVYIVCEEDEGTLKEFLQWMIDNYPVKHVIKIKGADHMDVVQTTRTL